jgi:hypothetical protein
MTHITLTRDQKDMLGALIIFVGGFIALKIAGWIP